ncbi:MAG: UDP-N-acetylglucosamine diphosphorylase [Verrucomicrobiales bacterium]|nr:UDP-N-acetylglucosamine diphosphorylase [Verrucomicrobiales bacterium]
MTFFPSDLFDLAETEHDALFVADEPVWTALSRIGDYLEDRLNRVESTTQQGSIDPRAIVGERVYIAPGAVVEANAVIKGPAWIGPGTVVRSGAYVRENVITGSDCVLGNSSEFKNCLLFNRCEVPHFNYVGDSILGYKAHLGAGVICSNVRLDRRPVAVRDGAGAMLETGLRKFGAIIGDRTEIGCNSVLSPGSILGRDCIVYPLTSWQGTLESHQIGKNRQATEVVERHEGK